MIAFGMDSPDLNEPRHPWYQKRYHCRIPKIAESKKYLDLAWINNPAGTGGGDYQNPNNDGFTYILDQIIKEP